MDGVDLCAYLSEDDAFSGTVGFTGFPLMNEACGSARGDVRGLLLADAVVGLR